MQEEVTKERVLTYSCLVTAITSDAGSEMLDEPFLMGYNAGFLDQRGLQIERGI